MNSLRKSAIIAGSLFLIAMICSLLGGGLLESIIKAQDYLTIIPVNKNVIFLGVFLEFINGIAVIGIAVTLFPILKQNNESIALGYVGFRIIESIFCIVSAVIPLSLIKLSKEYLITETSVTSYFHSLGNFLIETRKDLAELLIPVFFGLGALLFYYLLFKSKLIPRFISVWGFISALLILTLIFFEAGIIINMIFVLPIILNEIFLGIWLIVKGFNPITINDGYDYQV